MPTALYAYSFRVDGGALCRAEIQASTPEDAAILAARLHATQGRRIWIGRVFEAPPRLGSRVLHPLPLPRINYVRRLDERTRRRQAVKRLVQATA